MQKFLLIGYLGKDPEMKYTPAGTAITTFSVASTERWKNNSGEPQEHTEWFNIKTFGRRAEVAAEFLQKGSRIFLEGRQRIESWEDKQSGEKKHKCFVYADKFEFLGDSNRNGKSDAAVDEPDKAHGQETAAVIEESEEIPF